MNEIIVALITGGVTLVGVLRMGKSGDFLRNVLFEGGDIPADAVEKGCITAADYQEISGEAYQ